VNLAPVKTLWFWAKTTVMVMTTNRAKRVGGKNWYRQINKKGPRGPFFIRQFLSLYRRSWSGADDVSLA